MTSPEQSKAALMRRLRKERRDAGLVELRAWVTPEHRNRIEQYIAKMIRSANQNG